LLAGGLTGQDERAIEGHLETCDACQERLESLTYDEEGIPRGISCPDRSVLARMADGTLGTYAWETVERHLETCRECQADFDVLASGEDEDDWAEQVKSLKRQRAQESPGLKRVMGTLKEESSFEPDTGIHQAAVDQKEALDFLDPSDVAGDLGKLGSYRVLERLGSGGMGIVLKAFDPALNRPVAIKVLAPQLATSGPARQRFAREARAAAAIRNEHVVAIHSVDEWKGLPYLVMEFIPGSSLQERIDRAAPLDVNSILRIGTQAALGLAAAHAQGLVHRDIKPSNILLENGVERVKLTDFGLARAVDDASLTQTGVVAGTPLFMAPEQARCESIDHRADLFSLGTVLYAMCTGRSPFRASTTLGVLRRVCDESHRSVRQVNPEVPAFLAEIIDRLLAKEPRMRFQTATDVAEELNGHLARRQRGNAEETEAMPAPVGRPAAGLEDVGPAKEPQPRRRWVEIAAILIVVLAGLFVIARAAWATWNLPPLPELLGLTKPSGVLSIYWMNPELSVTVNDQPLPRGTYHYLFKEPAGYVVKVFKDNAEAATEFMYLKPGMSIELDILDDGKIQYKYDGPIRAPVPRMRATKESNPSKGLVFETKAFLQAVEPTPITIEQARVRLRQAELARDVAWAEMLRAKAELEKAIAKSDAAIKEMKRMEKLLGQLALSQEEFEEARANLAATAAERQVAEASAKAAETRSRRAVAEIIEAQARLDLAQASGADMAQNREPALRRLAEMPLRHAQFERELASIELDMARAALEGAVASRDYRKKTLARIRRLGAAKAVEQRLVDHAESQNSVAEAKVRSAEADIAKAEALLKAAEVKVRDAEAKFKSQ